MHHTSLARRLPFCSNKKKRKKEKFDTGCKYSVLFQDSKFFSQKTILTNLSSNAKSKSRRGKVQISKDGCHRHVKN